MLHFTKIYSTQTRFIRPSRSCGSVHRSYASEAEEYLKPKSIIPTYHFQKSLPHLPIPELGDSCKLYLSIVQPVVSESQFQATKKLVEDFQVTDGPKLQQKLKEIDAQNKHTSYISGPWYDMYLKGRYSVAINSNPFMVFNDFPDPAKNTQVKIFLLLASFFLKNV